MTHQVHEGRNVKRFREMLGIKQEALASDLGDDWSQKKVSQLEGKEKIEPAILQQVSSVLKIPVEAFQNFDEERAVSIISNTINNHDNAVGIQNFPVINTAEKWMESMEENKRLYERLLQTEREKVALLQGLLDREQ